MSATDLQCRAAIEAMEPDRIQGFTYEGRVPPHVVRDVYRKVGEQIIWQGDSREEMLERCQIERMRLGLNAALSIISS